MKKIVILSYHFGNVDRGVEVWASELVKRVGGVEIISGKLVYNVFKWISSDVVIPTGGRLEVLLVRIVTFFSRKPVIVFGHSGPGADDRWNLLCSPNVFVCFSESQKKWALKYKLPWTKIISIPHAVDTKMFRPAVKKPKQKTVLCVAANTKDKRIYLVKKAVERLKDVEFVAVGSGNDLQVEHKNMPKIYQKSSVFCFVPQSWEAFGLVFLEALASNLPVVTINDSVRREIVREAGILVEDPEDTGSLAKQIKKALDTNWGNKPRRQAEKFSWERISKKYYKLFNSL